MPIVIVAGDRNWIDEATIRWRLARMVEKLGAEVVVVHGDNGNRKARVGGRGQKGADRIAGRVAEEMGLKVARVPAHWRHHPAHDAECGAPEQDFKKECDFGYICEPGCEKVEGLAAGPIRNREMLTTGPVGVIIFHKAIDFAKGSKDMKNAAEAKGVPVDVVAGIRP